MEKAKKKLQIERGQSLVEIALSITFLTMLVAGVVDLGRAFFTYIALRDAAQEGAAFASISRIYPEEPLKCTEIISRAHTTSDTQIFDLNLATVNILYYDFWDINLTKPYPCKELTPAASPAHNKHACFGSTVVVQTRLENFPLVTPFMGTILGRQTIAIQASIEDTVLTPPCD